MVSIHRLLEDAIREACEEAGKPGIAEAVVNMVNKHFRGEFNTSSLSLQIKQILSLIQR